MANSADITVYTLKEFAKKFQDFFRGEPKDIIIKWMDDNGNKRSETIPNVAKVTEFLHKNGVTQAEMDKKVSDYYKKVENDLIRDKVLKELHDKYMTKSDVNKNFDGVNKRHNDLQKQVNSNHDEAKKGIVSNSNRINTTDKKVVETMKNLNLVQELLSTMNFSDFEKRREATKAQFLGSGFLPYKASDPYIGNAFNVTNHNQLPPFTIRKSSVVGDENKIDIAAVSRFNNKAFAGVKFNVNGLIMKHLKAPANAYGVRLPEAPMPRVIDDITNVPFDTKQADILVYADYTTNVVPGHENADNILKKWKAFRGKAEKVNDYEVKIISGKDTDGVIATPSDNDSSDRSVKLIQGARYVVEVEITKLNGTASFGLWNDTGVSKFMANITKPGKYRMEFTANRSRDRFHVYSNTHGEEHYVIFKNPTVRLIESTFITALYDRSKGNLLNVTGSFIAAKDGFRTDAWFKEVWYEDVSRKDVVFQLGDVNNGLNVKLDNVHAKLEVINMGDYSKFGKWDTISNTYGYRWSKLNIDDKIEFIKNPDNMMFFDKDVYMQVRQRDRVVRGVGYWSEIRNDATGSGLISSYNRKLMPQGYRDTPYTNYDLYGTSGTSIEGSDETKYSSFKSRKYNGTLSTWNVDVATCEIKDAWRKNSTNYWMIPIATIRRYNNGIYHPVFNTAGTALIYYSGEARNWYDVPLDYITKLEDCFDPSLIAAVKADGDIVSLNDKDAKYQTGDDRSKLRANGHYFNKFEPDQIRDQRFLANTTEDYDEIMHSTLDSLIRGNFRGQEDISKMQVIAIEERLTITSNVTTAKNAKIALYVSKGNNDYVLYKDGKAVYGYHGKIIDFVNYKLNERFRLVYKDSIKLSLVIPPKNRKYYMLPFKDTQASWNILGEVRESSRSEFVGRYTFKEMIGDPRTLSERVNITIDGDSVVKLNKFDYVKCNKNDKNNGKVGHYYRWLGGTITGVHTDDNSKGDPNKTNGHIDFNDTALWKDLGNNGDAGGLNEVVRRFGLDVSPNLVSYEGYGKINLPEFNVYTYNKQKFARVALNRKPYNRTQGKIIRIDTTTWEAKEVGYFRYNAPAEEVGIDALGRGADKVGIATYESGNSYADNYLSIPLDGAKSGDNTTIYKTEDMWKYIWIIEYEVSATLQSSYTGWNKTLKTYNNQVLFNSTTDGALGNLLQGSVMGKYRTGTRNFSEPSDMLFMFNLAVNTNKLYGIMNFTEGYRHDNQFTKNDIVVTDNYYLDFDAAGGTRRRGTAYFQLPFYTKG